jgi:hypothetical protein
MSILIFALNSDYIFSEEEYGYLVVNIIDTNTVTRIAEDQQITNNDETLNEVFKNFKVFSYKYAYSEAKVNI